MIPATIASACITFVREDRNYGVDNKSLNDAEPFGI